MLRYLLPLLIVATPAFADGYANPEFAGRTFKNVLVSVPVMDLKFREKMETKTIKYMQKYVDSVGVKSLDLFPPFLEATESDYIKKLKESGIDAVVVIEPSDAKGSFPPNYKHNSKTFAMGHVNTGRGRRISASITMYDVASGKSVWVGALGFKDDGDDIIKEVSYRTVKLLIKANLLDGKKKNEKPGTTTGQQESRTCGACLAPELFIALAL